jgi:hypothetical protein
MFEISPGQTIKDQISAFEDDGITKRSGLIAPTDFEVTVWQDCVVSSLPVTISEIGVSGEYCVEYTPPSEGWWKVEIHILFSGDIMKSIAAVGVSADMTSIKADLSRILGLLHYNSILDNQTYDSDDQLLTARLRVFDTASNVPAIPGGSETFGLKHQYIIEAVYSATNQSNKYTLKKVL